MDNDQPIQDKLDQARLTGNALLAVLVDPDRMETGDIPAFCGRLADSGADLLLVGGSLLTTDRFEQTAAELRKAVDLPVVIFPGHPVQITAQADAILLLSLISGRNAELLIGQHVYAAPALKQSGLEILPTGYMLIDGGTPTTVSYISNTQPIPGSKPDIAACTALAGQQLGLHNIYLDTGSGARATVPASMIRAVRETVSLPLIVGGGIRNADDAQKAAAAGADVIVVGTAVEQDAGRMSELADAVHGH